jgi:5-oxoprolinase (ATP-hydrolysing) subunit A
VDLNADVGEDAGSDDELLAIVTSASVACGAHAGSVSTMRRTIRRALELDVVIGAHPGYPDRERFGRMELGDPAETIGGWVREQVELIRDVCAEEGALLRYVKPHGAMYNRAVRDREVAAAIAEAVAASDPGLVLLALPGSAMLGEAGAAGLRTAREAFLDRGYLPDGTLAPRDEPGALLLDPAEASARALLLARGELIADIFGAPLRIEADSLCVHGDSAGALALARAARARLEESGINLRPFA